MTNRYLQEGNKNKGAAVLLHNFEGFYCVIWRVGELMMSVRTKDPLIFRGMVESD